MKMEGSCDIQALILCGGLATRLDPLGYFIPKPLLPIGGRPIIDYILDDVVDSGIEEITLGTNTVFSDQFEYWMAHYSAKSEICLRQVAEPLDKVKTLGAVGAINYVIENANIDTDLLIIAGDNFYDFKVKGMLDAFESYGRKQSVVGCYDVKELAAATRFGILELDNGNRVISFVEKPTQPKSTLASIAMYLLPKDHLVKIKEYLDSGNSPNNLGYFIKWLSEKTIVKGHRYEGQWHDIGTLVAYKKVFDEYAKKNDHPLSSSLFFE